MSLDNCRDTTDTQSIGIQVSAVMEEWYLSALPKTLLFRIFSGLFLLLDTPLVEFFFQFSRRLAE